MRERPQDARGDPVAAAEIQRKASQRYVGRKLATLRPASEGVFQVRSIAGPLTSAEYRGMTGARLPQPADFCGGPLTVGAVKIEPTKIEDENSPPDFSAITREISRGN